MTQHRWPSDQDSSYAFRLLVGLARDGNREFPSQNTSPTEKEARQALARILRNGDVPTPILRALSDHIDPDGKHQRRIEFKNRTQGHPKPGAHIAFRVHMLRQRGEKNAIDKAAKQVGKTPRHVARIYSKYRKQLENVWRLMELSKQLRKDDISS
jgi:hypothetical protein